MRVWRCSTWLVAGLAVMLLTIPGGSASAQGAGLNAKFDFSPETALVGQVVQFTDHSDGDVVYWEWIFGDSSISYTQNPEHIFFTSRVFEVRLRIYNAQGETDDEKKKITIVEAQEPNAGFTYAPAAPAVGEAVQFTDTSVGIPTSWEWEFDDGDESTEQNPMHTFDEAGDYNVELRVSNDAGSDDEIVQVSVYAATQPPEASFFYLPKNPTANEVVLFFDASGGGAADSWEWDFDDGSTSDEQYAQHIFDSDGSYNVSLTVSNDGGEDSIEQTVNVTAEVPPIDPDLDQVYFVPSASHASGAQGSFWVTDVDINNGGGDTATYKLAWLPRKQDNSSPTMSDSFTVGAGEAARIDDVVESIFGIDDGYGALAVVSDSADLFIFSRTYNDTDLGTFGTAVPGVAEKDLVQGNTRKRLLFFTEDGDFRSNIAFQNGTSSNLRVKWERYLADGTMVESGQTDLAPYSNKQLNAVYANDAPVEAAYMDVWTNTEGGKFMVFSSVVDNGTSDGTVVQPQW